MHLPHTQVTISNCTMNTVSSVCHTDITVIKKCTMNMIMTINKPLLGPAG